VKIEINNETELSILEYIKGIPESERRKDISQRYMRNWVDRILELENTIVSLYESSYETNKIVRQLKKEMEA
jgi:hypothetical protein